jgi:hypothetical protein
MRGLPFGVLACIPLALGAPPVSAREITGQLCGGGSITLKIPGRKPSRRDDCPKKACHAGTCREKFAKARFDGDQGRLRG